jgi:hypothetical protein
MRRKRAVLVRNQAQIPIRTNAIRAQLQPGQCKHNKRGIRLNEFKR